MKKNIKINKEQLQKIIKEGVAKLHRKTIIENRIQEIKKELNIIKEEGFTQYGEPMGFDNKIQNDGKIEFTLQVK